MARSLYKIAFARPGAVHLWHEMWGDPDNPTKEALAAHEEEPLGFTEMIEAFTFTEAVRLAQDKHPGFIVMKRGTGRVGSA
jgi:hypothetical protein